MMEKPNVLLSVVIIAHNQKELLRRCIDSVLQQETTFHVQVIVSDDCSTDGTREMLQSDYKDKVFITFYDSTKADTSITLERASFNRLNGLRYATGKYLIHIDGDDFFTSTDLFQEMVDTLETHPECTLCCQNFAWVDQDKLSEPYIPCNQSELLKSNRIITGEEYCNNLGLLVNSCFCMRRTRTWTPEDMQGIPYDDSLITARYIGDGKVAVLNRCDFVYVRYGASSFNSISEEDKRILFQPGIKKILLSPSLTGDYLRQNVGVINYISYKAFTGVIINNDLKKYYHKHNIFLYKHLGDNTLSKKIRYLAIFLLTFLIQVSHTDSRVLYRLLYKLAIGKVNNNVKI